MSIYSIRLYLWSLTFYLKLYNILNFLFKSPLFLSACSCINIKMKKKKLYTVCFKYTIFRNISYDQYFFLYFSPHLGMFVVRNKELSCKFICQVNETNFVTKPSYINNRNSLATRSVCFAALCKLFCSIFWCGRRNEHWAQSTVSNMFLYRIKCPFVFSVYAIASIFVISQGTIQSPVRKRSMSKLYIYKHILWYLFLSSLDIK